jgi:hypothetical protein
MAGVRVHYDSPRPSRYGALAFAQRDEIHLAPGQRSHLPHEAWHLVQQAQGRARPSAQMHDGTVASLDRSLEREADVMGRRALQRRLAAPVVVRRRSSPGVPVAQMSFEEKIKELVYKPESYRAQPLITDLADMARSFKKPPLVEEEFGANELMKVAKSVGYRDDYAARLAKKAPFTKEELDANTTVDVIGKGKIHIETFEQASVEPDGHNLMFANDFEDGGATVRMNQNYRNPMLAAFYAPDVMDYQRAVAFGRLKSKLSLRKTPPDFDKIIRHHVRNEKGDAWFKKHEFAGKVGDHALTSEQLQSFLADTDNGASSKKMAELQGREITAGTVTVEEDGMFNVELRLKKTKRK